MAYTVGNLEINIASSATAANANLDTLIKKLERVKKVMGTTVKQSSGISKIGPTSGGSSGGGGLFGGASGGFSFAATIGKLAAVLAIARRIGNALSKMVQYAIDYNETLNLWQVAMRDSLSQADKFISKLNKAYGISEQTLMNYQAIFKNMLSGLGDLSEATSYNLSELMTELAINFASLYNQTIESSMTKFQAILSGQVRPVRSVSGIDITENTIYDMYKQAGGDKTVRGLSQIEKRLLRIYVTFNQMQSAGALGDYAKTIEQAANQFRVMTEQAKETATWLGQMVLHFFAPALPYINAVLITLKEVFKTAAYAMGYVQPDFLAGMFETTAEGAQEAEDAVNSLMGNLSFDKFESLNKASGNILGIDPVILAMLEQMNITMGNVRMKATDIHESWMKTLGFTYNEKKELWEVGETLGTILKVFSFIGKLMKTSYNIFAKIFSFIFISPLKKTVSDIKKIYDFIKSIYIYLSSFTIQEHFSNLFSWLGENIETIGKNFGLMFVNLGINIANFFIKIANGIIFLINGLITPITKIGSYFGKNWKIETFGYLEAKAYAPLTAYAKGGVVEDGIFTMNRGELIGNFNGGSTVVANNQQIVQGIQKGVYSAVMAAFSQRKTNGGGDVYIDGNKVGKVIEKAVFNEGARIGHFQKV